MDSGQPSVTELREKFNKLNLIVQSKSRSSSMSNELANEPLHLDKHKTEGSTHSLNYSIVSVVKNPVVSSADNKSSSPNEAAASLAAILNPSQQKDENPKSTSRKPPMPPPRPLNPSRKNSTTSDSLPVLQNTSTTPIPARKKPPVPLPPLAKQKRSKSVDEESPSNQTIHSEVDVNTPQPEITSFESSSVPQDEPFNKTDTTIPSPPEVVNQEPITSTISPQTADDETESPYCELKPQTLDSSFSEDDFDDDIYYDEATQLPDTISNEKSELKDSNLSTISFDTILPSKCMFYEFETTINNYQRRQPRTILCPTIKPTMPKITTNEIDILQRYSNT